MSELASNDMKLSKSLIAFIAMVSLILGVGAWWLQSAPKNQPAPLQLQSATLLPYKKPVVDFQLIDQRETEFNQQNLKDHWSFISFGYTYCPDVCPTNLAMLSRLQERIRSMGFDEPLQVLFVSVDPERDKPQRLDQYMNYFNPDFVGLTGSKEQLVSLTRSLGIMYAKVEQEQTALGYLMDHSASVLLFNPSGEYHALFSPPHDDAQMAVDFIKIAQQSSKS